MDEDRTTSVNSSSSFRTRDRNKQWRPIFKNSIKAAKRSTNTRDKKKIRSKKLNERLLQEAREELKALEQGRHPVFQEGVRKLNEEFLQRKREYRIQSVAETTRIEEQADKEMKDAVKDFRTEAEVLRQKGIEDLNFERKRIRNWKANWKMNVAAEGWEHIDYTPIRALRSNSNVSLHQNSDVLKMYTDDPEPNVSMPMKMNASHPNSKPPWKLDKGEIHQDFVAIQDILSANGLSNKE